MKIFIFGYLLLGSLALILTLHPEFKQPHLAKLKKILRVGAIFAFVFSFIQWIFMRGN